MTRARPYLIGLTGNLCVGKSTVAEMLGNLGADVVDADRIAHEVIRAGTPVFAAVVETFGRRIVGPDGEIDRRLLAEIVFSDASSLARLERLVHPATIQAVQTLARTSASDVVVVEAVKLIASSMSADCDSVWVVTSRPEQQVERAVARGMSEGEAKRRMRSQSSQAHKVAHADVVIDNSGTLAETEAQVTRAWRALADVMRCLQC